MKALIWVLCFFAYIFVTVMIKEAGILLGGIPAALLFAGMWWLAGTLCKAWDAHNENKKLTSYYKNSQAEASVRQRSNEAHLPPQPTLDAVPGANQWKCSCGRIHAIYESSCVCGKTKMESRLQNQNGQDAAQQPAARYCTKCGFQLLPDSRFCSKCGSEVRKVL